MPALSVAEFMEKPYKRYSCKQIQTAQKTLANAFKGGKPENKAEELKQFKEVLKGLDATPKGQETLVELAKLGYDFFFDVGKFGGYCSHHEKKIALNPECGINYMQNMAVHEGRHAIQKKYQEYLPYHWEMDIESAMKFHRAKEADATAHEAAFIYQTRETNPENFAREMKSAREPIVAYTKEMDSSGNEKKAMQESFKAWYSSEFYQKHYDKEHLNFVKVHTQFGIKDNEAGQFSQSVSNKEIANMCRHNGQPYMPASFFSSEHATSIPKKDKETILKLTAKYAKHVGEVPDMSVLRLKDRAEKTPKPKTKLQSASTVAAVKRKQASR